MINNSFYDILKDDWYTANNHPIALLRSENKCRSPWVQKEIRSRIGENAKILDVGCGGGFLSNDLAKQGHNVTGIDLSQTSLEVAKRHDTTQKAQYLQADAYALPFDDHSLDVVCAMDILEHVENPAQLIREASRVMKKDGLFFYHTFNRTWLSYLIVIKGVDWFVKNAPKNMHVYNLFITPKELQRLCASQNLTIDFSVGLIPQMTKSAFWKMLYTREVPSDYSFQFSKMHTTGYCGIAIKR